MAFANLRHHNQFRYSLHWLIPSNQFRYSLHWTARWDWETNIEELCDRQMGLADGIHSIGPPDGIEELCDTKQGFLDDLPQTPIRSLS